MARPHPAVGIDLGTTFSAVAYVDASGRPETIRNSEGGLTTPSAIFFDRSRPIVGFEAQEAGLHEPQRLALFAKRDMGESQYRRAIGGEIFPPEVLQALVLRKLKEDAELKLGPIRKAVVTVPAFFNEPCRKATQDAGRLAGLEVLDIINEPTAAAICFGVEQGFLSADGTSEREERVLVYDLGGGTFDVTVMEIKDRNYHTVATCGDVYLGGLDWDRRIIDYIAEAFADEHGIDPREIPTAEQELLRKANQAKHALTQRESVSIHFAHGNQRIRTDLDQETFKRLSEDLLERTLMTVQLVMDEAGVTWNDLTRLILVGGSTRMPMIRDELSRLSGLELDRSLSPDEAVCHGAAIYAGILLGQKADAFSGVSVTNVNSHDLGVLAVDPASGQPRRQIMIPKNTSLPARKLIRFRTHTQSQTNVKVEVVEGGDDRGTNSTQIGKCVVDQLPVDTPKGTFVDVQFDYAQDGRLTVSAELPTLDCAAQMTMNRAAGMSEDVLKSWQQRMESGLEVADAPSPAVTNETSTRAGANPSPVPDVSERPIVKPRVKTKSKKKPDRPAKIAVPPEVVEAVDVDKSVAEPNAEIDALSAFLGAASNSPSPDPPVIDFSSLEDGEPGKPRVTEARKKLRRVSKPETPAVNSERVVKPPPAKKKLVRKSAPKDSDDGAARDWKARRRKLAPGDPPADEDTK